MVLHHKLYPVGSLLVLGSWPPHSTHEHVYYFHGSLWSVNCSCCVDHSDVCHHCHQYPMHLNLRLMVIIGKIKVVRRREVTTSTVLINNAYIFSEKLSQVKFEQTIKKLSINKIFYRY
jgi:NAD-dependent SIR2 family protein deacetylase